MTTRPEERPIVVGIDGSRAAERAARWAAEQARDRGAGLQLVHALTWPYEGVVVASNEDKLLEKGLRSGAEQLLRKLTAELAPVLPSDRIGWRIEPGDPVAALCADSANAQEIVMGGRGIGGIGGCSSARPRPPWRRPHAAPSSSSRTRARRS